MFPGAKQVAHSKTSELPQKYLERHLKWASWTKPLTRDVYEHAKSTKAYHRKWTIAAWKEAFMSTLSLVYIARCQTHGQDAKPTTQQSCPIPDPTTSHREQGRNEGAVGS